MQRSPALGGPSGYGEPPNDSRRPAGLPRDIPGAANGGIGSNPLAQHQQPPAGGSYAPGSLPPNLPPPPPYANWMSLRHNPTENYADASTRANKHLEYNYLNNLSLQGIDVSLYYRPGMPAAQDFGAGLQVPPPPPGPPPGYGGPPLPLPHNPMGFGAHEVSLDPIVPPGSFTLDLGQLQTRVQPERRMFLLHEDNAVLMPGTTITHLVDQDPMWLWHILVVTWNQWRLQLNKTMRPEASADEHDKHMQQQSDKFTTLSRYLMWNNGSNGNLQQMLDAVFPLYYKWMQDHVMTYDEVFKGPPSDEAPAPSKLGRSQVVSMTSMIGRIAMNGMDKQTLSRSRFFGTRSNRDALIYHLATSATVVQQWVTMTGRTGVSGNLYYVFPGWSKDDLDPYLEGYARDYEHTAREFMKATTFTHANAEQLL